METPAGLNFRLEAVIDLSVIIVSFNVRTFLERSLGSVQRARGSLKLEIFVVDNASEDGTAEMVRRRFPEAKLIETGENLGFAKANNLALGAAGGRYLMLLNPDTLVSEGALETLVGFLDAHPAAGAAGPKLLNRDGSFQSASKRGLPTPWAAFCKLSGLSALFPRTRFFNRYEMGHLDADESNEVEVLSGAAMIVRREVHEQVGGLDADYFMFGEDIDWSQSIRKAGWKLFYVPASRIVHYKGESTRRSRTYREKYFYAAMRIFARKHFRFGLLSRLMVELGILAGEAAAKLRRTTSFWLPAVLDLLIVFVAFVLSFHVRFEPPLRLGIWVVTGLYPLITLGTLLLLGIYRSYAPDIFRLFVGVILGFALVSSLAYFVKPIQFSRFVIVMAMGMSLTGIIGWRYTLLQLGVRFARRRVSLVGLDELGRAVLERIRDGRIPGRDPVGWIVHDPENLGEEHDGLPVLGLVGELESVAGEHQLDELLFSTASTSYEEIFRIVSKQSLKRLGIQIIPEGFDLNEGIPLIELDVGGGLLRRLAGFNRSQAVMRRG